MKKTKNEHAKRKFSNEEDALILKLVKDENCKSWKEIALKLKNRSARQCRERWKHYLSQDINSQPWTLQEDIILNNKYSEYGPRWSLITQSLPGRTDVNIKNRWALLCRKNNKKKPLYKTKGDSAKLIDTKRAAMYGLPPTPAPIYIPNPIIPPPMIPQKENLITPQPVYQTQDSKSFFDDIILEENEFHTDSNKNDKKTIEEDDEKEQFSLFDQFLKEVKLIQNQTNEDINDFLYPPI